MNSIPLYPLRFEPIYQYRLWDGRRVASLLSAPLPGDSPIGEAWLLSDRDDHPSNDYPAKEAGALSIQVRDPNESKRVIEAIIACLDGAQPTKPPEETRL
jgi:mannose-6-phosphate isomerase class I